MKRPRRNHSATFKAKVALAAIKGDKTLVDLAEQFKVHPNQIAQWRAELLERARENARIANAELEFREGDVEALPFEDATFDVLLSQFGHMFAPRPEMATTIGLPHGPRAIITLSTPF